MLLQGKKGLVLNVANKNSLAWAIAQAAVAHGAEVGVGAQNERMLESVEKLVDGSPYYEPFIVDFTNEQNIQDLVFNVKQRFGKIDFLVHSAAFAPREALTSRFIETTSDDFKTALDISCYSLIHLCKALEDVFNEDASVMTLSYLGSQRAMQSYNVMGVAKAALEATVRYLTIDLGQKGIRVNTLSPGPINTLAARGVKNLSQMISSVHEKTPLRRAYAQEEVGSSAVYLMSDLSKGVTGQIIYIDSGYSIMAI